jgi:hypothetical protein
MTTLHRSLSHADYCSQSRCLVMASNGRRSSASWLILAMWRSSHANLILWPLASSGTSFSCQLPDYTNFQLGPHRTSPYFPDVVPFSSFILWCHCLVSYQVYYGCVPCAVQELLGGSTVCRNRHLLLRPTIGLCPFLKPSAAPYSETPIPGSLLNFTNCLLMHHFVRVLRVYRYNCHLFWDWLLPLQVSILAFIRSWPAFISAVMVGRPSIIDSLTYSIFAGWQYN